MRQVTRLLKLSRTERSVLLYACMLLNGIRLALWLLPFNFVRQKLAQISTVWVCDNPDHSIRVSFIVKAVNIATRYTPGGAKCLVRALTAQLFLNRYGYSHQLHIGVAKGADNTLEAHAWIEYKDHIIVGWLSNLSRFKSLTSEGVK
ncbi:lasso peptide biosynthesis B2 protein [Leptothoe sp. PORK10 BA2]|uniref:lasso peptide biosynthesis B2 protein n=1 Tax=Leptothoe sp. PORK10 BA2 TaxID=3110254 RepID=UPI002B2042D9|nr:lasso peptide biosynthesis B2 protein [Leptothoe sp. PORK10 BA2]MEA5466122.1 lasso peptide biosynthesis B2 protein [Leptothoe sp. PORK10 BA2]